MHTPYLDKDVLIRDEPALDMPRMVEAWRAMGYYLKNGKISYLGLCNLSPRQLEAFLDRIESEKLFDPAVIQMPLFFQADRHEALDISDKDSGYSSSIRKICTERRMQFQGYWVLSANVRLRKAGSAAHTLAMKADVSPEVALYGLFLGTMRITILNGTKNHIEIDQHEIKNLASWTVKNREEWHKAQTMFMDDHSQLI